MLESEQTVTLNIVLVGENVIGDGENTALGGGIMTDGTHIFPVQNLNINTNRSNRATTHDALDANGAVSIKDAVLTIKDWAASRFSSDNIYFLKRGHPPASTIILDAVTITGENLDSIAVTPDQNITIKNSKMEVTNSFASDKYWRNCYNHRQQHHRLCYTCRYTGHS